jgi:drug/metabolite transporter (DMT)-like permease
MNLTLFASILTAVFLSAVAQLLLKLGVNGINEASTGPTGAVWVVLRAVQSPSVWLGLFVYVASVGLWLYVLSKADLTVAYPFVGLSFIATLVFGIAFLGEHITMSRLLGTLLIAGGCILVAQSA